MTSIIPQNNLLDEVYLHKHSSEQKMRQVMAKAQDLKQQKIVKTASKIDPNTIVSMFSQMLNSLNMCSDEDDMKEMVDRIARNEGKIDDIRDMVSSIANGQNSVVSTGTGNIDKVAFSKNSKEERKDEIKIVSKNLKDSHYQVDVSKDLIQQNGQEVFMVSCYARDAYLGRYLIKRNFFYTKNRNKSANETYDEILTKVANLKDRYYNDLIDVSAISTQLKKILDGVISEIEIKEDSLGTNIKR